MEVTCKQCDTTLNIPDEKIPKDQMARVSCPKCKTKITIDPKTTDKEDSSLPDPYAETGKLHLKFIEPTQPTSPEETGYDYEDYTEDEDLEFFEEDVKLALIMIGDENNAKRVRSIIEKMGYKCVEAPNTREALGKMRFHHFDLIFLSDGYDGQELQYSPIINYLNHINISSRRRIFLALISDNFRSMDEI